MLPVGPAQADGQHVLVMLGRRQPCSELGLEMLAASYGLTLAERRVLGALVREASPRSLNDQFGEYVEEPQVDMWIDAGLIGNLFSHEGSSFYLRMGAISESMYH